MIVTIHQPDFLPWLGFFDRWRQSDLYVVLDDVQFLRRGWHHRDKIKSPGGPAWLTVPVLKKGQYEQQIRETEIDWESPWPRRHEGLLGNAYRAAPGYARTMEALLEIYGRRHATLMELNLDLLRWAGERLGITVPMVLASSYDVGGVKTERLVRLMQAVGGTTYLSGLGAKAYLEEDAFAGRGLSVRWQSFEHPVYPQLHGEFAPMLSVLDFFMMDAG